MHRHHVYWQILLARFALLIFTMHFLQKVRWIVTNYLKCSQGIACALVTNRAHERPSALEQISDGNMQRYCFYLFSLKKKKRFRKLSTISLCLFVSRIERVHMNYMLLKYSWIFITVKLSKQYILCNAPHQPQQSNTKFIYIFYTFKSAASRSE